MESNKFTLLATLEGLKTVIEVGKDLKSRFVPATRPHRADESQNITLWAFERSVSLLRRLILSGEGKTFKRWFPWTAQASTIRPRLSLAKVACRFAPYRMSKATKQTIPMCPWRSDMEITWDLEGAQSANGTKAP